MKSTRREFSRTGMAPAEPFYQINSCKCKHHSRFILSNHNLTARFLINDPRNPNNKFGLSAAFIGWVLHCSIDAGPDCSDPDKDPTLLSSLFMASDYAGTQCKMRKQTAYEHEFTKDTLTKNCILNLVGTETIFILRTEQFSKSTQSNTVRSRSGNQIRVAGYKLVKLISTNNNNRSKFKLFFLIVFYFNFFFFLVRFY